MSNKVLVIWDGYNQEKPKNRELLLWSDFEDLEGENQVSIPRIVEKNSEELKLKYLSLVYELSKLQVGDKDIIEHLQIRPNFSYWWMTLLSEKNNYSKSPQINNIIKLIAFDKWFNKSKYNEIILVSEDGVLSNGLSLWADKNNLNFKCDKGGYKGPRKITIKNIYSRLPYFIQALIWMFRQLVTYWQLKGVGVNEWKKSVAKTTFVSYLGNLNQESFSSNIFSSQYWTNLIPLLKEQKIKTNWLHMYTKSAQFSNSSEAANFIKKLNNKSGESQVHTTLYSFISIFIVLAALKDYLKLIKTNFLIKKHIEVESGYFWPFIKKDYLSSMAGSVAINNLLNFHLFNKATSLLPQQKSGFYLKENQAWEFSFIYAWRTNKHSEKLMGIPHATVCFWDLRYFFDIRSYKQNKNNSLPLPDKVGVNGSASKKMYISGGYPCQDIIEVEALRFLYLDRVKKSRVIINNRLLVLTDYLEENVKLQMNLLKKALLQCREKIELIVKPHPFCPISIDDFPEMDIKIINNKTIYQAMKCCNVVFTSNITSAAVDSFCSGKVVISMLNPKTVNMSPLKDNGIIFVSTPDELVNYLNNLNNLNNSTNQKSDFFFTNPNLDKWNNILKNYCN